MRTTPRPTLRPTPIPALLASMALCASAAAQDFEPSLVRARERAAEEGRVLVCVLLAEDEGRSEALVDAFAERALAPWLSATLEVAGLLSSGEDGKRKKGIGGRAPDELRRIAPELRAQLLLENEGGVVAVPQTVWLGPEGDVLLSVPYELDADELEWCFAAAQARAGLEPAAALGKRAHAPRRLLFGGLYQPPAVDTSGRGLTTAELEEHTDQLRRQPFGGGVQQRWIRLLFTYDPDAADFARTELSRGFLGWLRGDTMLRTVDFIGAASPGMFWQVIEDLCGNNDADVRHHVAAALEQLAPPDARKAVRRAFDKEEEQDLRGAWLRAMTACGPDDRATRKKVLGVVSSSREPLALRVAALVACGHLRADEDLRELLAERLTARAPEERLAAAAAVALARDSAQRTALEAAREAASDEREREGLDAALAVLDGGDLLLVQALIEELCDDDLPRPRLFFFSGGALGVGPR